MRIIQGEYKGRKLAVPEGIRPVAMLVKKACFDVLSEVVVSAKVLDLFAGSGSLGFEALSLGAKRALFIESDSKASMSINQNIRQLGVSEKAELLSIDAFSAVQRLAAKGQKFDLIFIDPPYYKGMLTKALQTLNDYDILAPFGWLISFSYSKDQFPTGLNFTCVREKNYGQTNLRLLVRK